MAFKTKNSLILWLVLLLGTCLLLFLSLGRRLYWRAGGLGERLVAPEEPQWSWPEPEATPQHVSSGRWRRLARTERKPILNEFSFPANLVQGMRFVLMCQVLDSAESPVQIKWFKDDTELTAESSAQEQPQLAASDELSASLLFRRVQQQHSGNYTCLAANHFGSSSYSSYMSVKVPPKWRLEPQDQESIMGEQIVIDCQAQGNPNPFIRWKFASFAALQQRQQQQQQQQQQQHQQHQQHQQQQQQLQRANSELDTEARSQQLVELAQSANGGPSFKLINSNHHVQTLENGSLSIRQLNKDHEGLYLCEADNGVEPNLLKVVRLLVHHQAQLATEIQVLDAPPDQANPPAKGQLSTARLLRVTQNTTQLRLLCQPLGDPPLSLQWLKDGQPIYTSGQLSSGKPLGGEQEPNFKQPLESRYHVNTRKSSHRSPPGTIESELVVTNLRRSDAGLYSCLARNNFGQADKKLRLVVVEPPEPPDVVDVAHISSRSIGLRWLAPFDGNTPIVKYIVEYRKYPATDAHNNELELSGPWSGLSEKLMTPKESNELATSSAGSQLQHMVDELEPLTRYSMRIVAVNSVGRSRPSVALSLRTDEEVPSVVPTLVEVLVLSSKSIKLHWTISYSPEHQVIDGFFIGYRSFEGSSAEPKQLKQSPQEQPTFTYKTIRVVNENSQEHMRHLGDLQQPPQNTRLDAFFLSPVSSLTKTLPPASTSSFARHSNPTPGQVVVASAFEYVINGLDRNTEYTVLIQCFNKKGAGPTSDPVVFRTFLNDPPEKLALSVDEVSETSLKLSWRFLTPPPIDHPSTSSKSPDPLDGYVLSFANLAHKRPRLSDHTKLATLYQRDLKPAETVTNTTTEPLLGSDRPSDIWQTIQLGPQHRSYQLKNLNCGTLYGLQVWAFNKIGKGEPSELVSVRTRGKAPVTPDKRSFISANSSHVKLNLGAWYDGGCDIDKFVIHYRARGQQEWILVSNNILKEQNQVIIRDLVPATSYELLVSAFNQVGPTEVKYRFMTLDADGKQVVGHSFLANLPAFLDDYTDEPSDRPDLWLGQESAHRSLAMFRYLLGSPLALLLSLVLFVLILMMLIAYKLNSLTSTSRAPTNKANSNGGHGSCGDPNTNMILDSDTPLNAPNSSLDSSPRLNLSNEQRSVHASFPQGDCLYQSFCSMPTSQQPVADYAHSMGPDCSPYLPSSYGHDNYMKANLGAYASVQHRALLDQIQPDQNPADQEQDSQQQQCLMQMLLMGPQQHQTSEANLIDQNHSSYVADALTTLTRNTSRNVKLSRLADNNCNSFANGHSSATLGRHQTDNLPLRARHLDLPGFSTGKQSMKARVSGQNASNEYPTTTDLEQSFAKGNLEEAFPMSTFKLAYEEKLFGDQLIVPLSSSNYASSSDASTSGCGTATGSSFAGVSGQMDIDQANAPRTFHLVDQSVRMLESKSSDRTTPANQLKHGWKSDATSKRDQRTCDRSSQYDVPFKFTTKFTQSDLDQDATNTKAEICY